MKLRPKEEMFCQLCVVGSQTDAYITAYNSVMNRKACSVAACEIASRPHIKARIQELKDELAEKELWKRIDSLKVLIEVAQNDKARAADRVSAVKVINSMHGWDKQTINHTSSDGSLGPTHIVIEAAETVKKIEDESDGQD